MIKPLENKVAILPDERVKVTPGGIHLPGGNDAPTGKGQVYKIGSKCQLLKTGDTVLYNAFDGNTIELNGQQYVIIKEDEVLAVVEE